MTDSFMQNHQLSLDLQREEDEINWLGFGPDTEDTEDEDFRRFHKYGNVIQLPTRNNKFDDFIYTSSW